MSATQTIFELIPRKNKVLIRPRGDAIGFLEADISRELDRLLRWIEESDPLAVIIDLGGSAYFGSIMIGAVNQIGECVTARGGRMVLCQASADMLAILQVMKLIPRWDHCDSLKDAERMLR